MTPSDGDIRDWPTRHEVGTDRPQRAAKVPPPTSPRRKAELRVAHGHAAMLAGTPDYGESDADTDAVDTIVNILHARTSDPEHAAELVDRALVHHRAEAGQ